MNRHCVKCDTLCVSMYCSPCNTLREFGLLTHNEEWVVSNDLQLNSFTGCWGGVLSLNGVLIIAIPYSDKRTADDNLVKALGNNIEGSRVIRDLISRLKSEHID